jgi:hypothetical protein
MIKAIFFVSSLTLLSSPCAFAQATPNGSQTPAPSSGGLAQPPGIQDRPKVYQPANPAPDTRAAPTSSSAGVGADSGGHPENAPKK